MSTEQPGKNSLLRAINGIKTDLASAPTPKAVEALMGDLANIARQTMDYGPDVHISYNLTTAFASDRLAETTQEVDKIEQRKIEAEKALAASLQADQKYPPAPGLQHSVFQLMNPQERELFLSIDPAKNFGRLALGADGMPQLDKDGKILVIMDDENPLTGKEVRGALVTLKRFTLTDDERKGLVMTDKEKAAEKERAEKPGAFGKELDEVGDAIESMRQYQARMIEKKNKGMLTEEAKEEFKRLHERTQKAVDDWKSAKKAYAAFEPYEGKPVPQDKEAAEKRARAAADLEGAKGMLKKSVKENVIDPATPYKDVGEPAEGMTAPEKGAAKPLPVTLAPSGNKLPDLSDTVQQQQQPYLGK